MKIKELFSDRSKWIQHDMSVDYRRRFTAPNSNDACCWCLVGAIIKCYPEDLIQQGRVMERIRLKIGNDYGPIYKWNDAIGRTFEDVKQLVEELDI